MHKLPEEAPLLVYYFLTLFLSNYKLRLIFIHFLDHINLLSIGAHLLTHFVRSLVRLALPSLRCGRFAAHFVRSFRSLQSLLALTSVAQSSSLRFALKAPLGRYTTSAHFVHTCCIAWFSNFSSINPHCDIEFAFRFALYNSLSRVHEIVQFVRTITFFDSLRPCFRKNTPFSFHLDCSIACTITF